MKEIDALDAAWAWRQPLIAELGKQGTDSYRLFCGEAEGIPGLKVDKMGDAVFLYRFEGQCALSEAELKAAAEWCLAKLSVKAVYLKDFATDRSKATAAAEANKNPVPLAGETLPEEISILENGVRLLVRPYDGFSTGIFLDQRDNRKLLASDVSGQRVLNLFAYTCAFSVYAAKGGAEVTSVDLSTRYLDWGKRNFVANGLRSDEYEFFGNDAFQFLKGARKRLRKFDLVILDPPSFSRDREGNVFSIAKDAGRLAEAAAEVVEPGGALFFSSNYEQWTAEQFLQATGLPRLGAVLPWVGPPLDFEKQEHPLLAAVIELA